MPQISEFDKWTQPAIKHFSDFSDDSQMTESTF